MELKELRKGKLTTYGHDEPSGNAYAEFTFENKLDENTTLYSDYYILKPDELRAIIDKICEKQRENCANACCEKCFGDFNTICGIVHRCHSVHRTFNASQPKLEELI